ncbi:MAG: ribosomal-processing cysteine protease Prp [Bacillota bacterium]|nr:ribosomal-processing cysteine protease Prp [Bacillota bacterium]
MTVIRMLEQHGTLTGFEVKGHAGAGTEGNDLVCAAISFLATTCANALEEVAGKKPLIKQGEAYLKAELPLKDISVPATVILRTFYRGAKDLLEAHPEHVSLIDK